MRIRAGFRASLAVAMAIAIGGLSLGGCASSDDAASQQAGSDVSAVAESEDSGNDGAVEPGAGDVPAAEENEARSQSAGDGGIVIDEALVTDQASFYDYESNGTVVEMLAVRASDGTVRLAFNTCQSCAGSPDAYFVQEEGELVCQNCGNTFPIDTVGKAKARGCNPIPISLDECTVEDGTITVPASLLEGSSDLFVNWKAGE